MTLVERCRKGYGDFSDKPASVERCFHITNLYVASAELVASYVRRHWAVENNLHWQLDVSIV